VQGDNVFTTALITPEGGTIALVDTLAVMAAGIPVQLDFPPGAVAQPTLVTIAETLCPDPSGHELYSPVYEILPRDLVLSQAVKIQLPITGSHPNNTLGGGQFGIYVDTGTGYTRLGNSYLNAGFFQGSLNHLGSVFVGYDKSDPFCAAAGGPTN